MTPRVRALGILTLGAVVATVAWLLGTDPVVVNMAVLGAGMVAGEILELRPAGRAPLPLSFAVVTVLVTEASPQAVAVLVAAECAAAIVRVDVAGFQPRVARFAERCAAALAAGALYQLVHLIDARSASAVELAALAAAATTPIVVTDAAAWIRERTFPPLRARSADVALVTSGILMAIGYEGLGGDGQLGLWGPILFSIPLIAAWYSFELLASTRRSFEQTIEALAVAPELGGLVRRGHAARVADLATAMGRVLLLSEADLEHLRIAAQLHHLGSVCLDEPGDGSPLDPAQVAHAGAVMLRASDALAPAGDVVAAEPLLHRPPGSQEPPAALAGMILKVASAYDELTEGNDEHAAWAVEALYTGPGYVYDGRVLGALELVLERRGVLEAR